MVEAFVKAFIMILAIMDAFGGIPMFLGLTKYFPLKRMRRSANRATVVAGIIIVLFIFFGGAVLEFFSITLSSFKIAGGLILLLVGVTYVLDLRPRKKSYTSDITVPMATPLIAGPGVITSVIILTGLYGVAITLAAALLNLFIFWLLMYYSNHLHQVIGDQGAEIISRIMGLIITAIAVEFVMNGIMSMI